MPLEWSSSILLSCGTLPLNSPPVDLGDDLFVGVDFGSNGWTGGAVTKDLPSGSNGLISPPLNSIGARKLPPTSDANKLVTPTPGKINLEIPDINL